MKWKGLQNWFFFLSPSIMRSSLKVFGNGSSNSPYQSIPAQLLSLQGFCKSYELAIPSEQLKLDGSCPRKRFDWPHAPSLLQDPQFWVLELASLTLLRPFNLPYPGCILIIIMSVISPRKKTASMTKILGVVKPLSEIGSLFAWEVVAYLSTESLHSCVDLVYV